MLTKKPPVSPVNSVKQESNELVERAPRIASSSSSPAKAVNSPAVITVKYNCGFGNCLFIRGDGAGLSWDKGIQLKNIDSDTWVWEGDRPFTQFSFKVLLNDEIFELGDDHVMISGSNYNFSPNF